MWWSHPTWCLVVAISVLASGAKVPRQIVYQIRPAPLSAFNSQDGHFLLEDGVTEFQFPTFGLKSGLDNPQTQTFNAAPTAEVIENDSSSSSSSSSSPSEEASSSTKEEITDVPRYGASQGRPVQQQYLQLQPEQIQQIFQQIQPQLQQQQPQPLDVGPRYEYRSTEDSAGQSEDIKTAQSEFITEDKLQSAYSERKEKRKKKQETPLDASYAFGYETDEAARHEVADPNGNVKGWYTYVDDEGTVRKIIYTAGAGKGFVVLGKEKVRGPPPTSPPRRQKQQSNRVNSDFIGYSADTSTLASVKHAKPPATPPAFNNFYSANNWNDLAKAGTSNPPVPNIAAAEREPPPSKKKPVFIVKIRRPLQKEQYHKHHLSDPEPLSVPVTNFKSRSRRKPMTLSDVVPSLRKQRIKKYPTPPIYYADDDDSGDSSNQGSSASSSASGEDGSYRPESREGRGGGGGGELPVKTDLDSSYVFGYETDTSNRLEKADPFGNVRGSYSYIDPDGVKRTVHYVAGGKTGFQVIHASPSVSRGVRLEAPAGYVVKRVPSLRTAESRYPIPITVPQPSAIVYHIHPDSGWKPWEPTLRKKKIKIHRKKLPKAAFENPQREGIVLLQTHADPQPNIPQKHSPQQYIPQQHIPSPPAPQVTPVASNTYFKETITAAGGHVTASETQYPLPEVTIPPPVIPRRRHTPQRGYTGEHHLLHFGEDDDDEHIAATTYRQPKSMTLPSSAQSAPSVPSMTPVMVQAIHEREPLLYSPTFESLKDSGSSRMPTIPNPIQLQPTQVAIKIRGAPTQSGLETSSSNHHPVAFTSDGKLQVDVPTVIIEAIEGKSPSLAKDVNKNAAAPSHQQLPEAAALTQSSSNSAPYIKIPSTPTTPSYESSGASYPPTNGVVSQPPSTAAASTAVNTLQSTHVHLPSNANQLQQSPTPRTRRRHHRSKTPATTPTSPSPSSSASSSSHALRAASSGNSETTTMMSNSKRLINRLAVTDHDAGQQ